jgi:hypothetical protein
MRIIVIPDTQVKPGVPMDHLGWAGKFIVEQKPDVVVHLGDHYDMHSLGYYDMGKKKGEGARISEDIDAGNVALARLMKPIQKYNLKRRKNKEKLYRPRLVALIGNHEQRIERYIHDNPVMHGTIGYHQFHWEDYGWEVHDFLEIVEIAGVRYSHFFANPSTGKPYTGMMETRLKNIGFPFTQGHVQGLKTGMRELGDGMLQRGMVAGSFYLHDEQYRGPQSNHEWKGILVKNECHNGQYDLMEISVNYLCLRYEGVPIGEFLWEKYGMEWKHRA